MAVSRRMDTHVIFLDSGFLFRNCFLFCYFLFFFKQKTAYEIKECDWSSDVCSSDLFILTGHLFDHQFAVTFNQDFLPF